MVNYSDDLVKERIEHIIDTYEQLPRYVKNYSFKELHDEKIQFIKSNLIMYWDEIHLYDSFLRTTYHLMKSKNIEFSKDSKLDDLVEIVKTL